MDNLKLDDILKAVSKQEELSEEQQKVEEAFSSTEQSSKLPADDIPLVKVKSHNDDEIKEDTAVKLSVISSSKQPEEAVEEVSKEEAAPKITVTRRNEEPKGDEKHTGIPTQARILQTSVVSSKLETKSPSQNPEQKETQSQNIQPTSQDNWSSSMLEASDSLSKKAKAMREQPLILEDILSEEEEVFLLT
ncbi:MAG: hypothetical protein ACK5MJ_05985 [Alphaproteobacteria bacterium]